VTVTHYDVLGVRNDATADEIRRAYVTLARRHHPDFHAASGDVSVASAEERMRQINLAWQVLGDTDGRAAYDRSLGLRDDAGPVSSGPIIKQPSSAFRPYEPPDEDDDSWRYEPDEGDPATVPPKALLVAPPALFVLGLVLLIASMSIDSRGVMVAGVMCLALSFLAFIGTPVVAMFRSQSAEDRASRRR
jgi:hypothetical protein